MQRSEEDLYAGLSPFELKNRLVALAKGHGAGAMHNAGRGNPNWIALAPRAAFLRLGEFALAEAQLAALAPDLGGPPPRPGIAARLQAALQQQPAAPGHDLLLRGIALAQAQHGIAPDALVGEWVDGVLGDHYPLPVRMLAQAETLVRAHLVAELFGGDAAAGGFELFAVEGASAGIAYVFQSLVQARLLAPGDRIALGLPIFTPYLELARLPEYRFEVVPVAQDPAAGWAYPAEQLAQLRDPRVKLFLAVNPSNPSAVAMSAEAVAQIGQIVRERPELIVVTDDVYAPFVEGFRSLAAVAPRNTIVVYSFSKFWGATGLRLGVVGLHAANALDERLQSAAGDARAAAQARYGAIATDPARLKLIDRLVADSRAVGLNHTAGLSTPQQVQMTLCALDALLDSSGTRKRLTRALVAARSERLYRGLGLPWPDHPLCTHYYATLDIAALARQRHGPDFAAWLQAELGPIGFVLRLARERGIVVLDGAGFGAPPLSVRVSLANLPPEAYEPIGRGIVGLLDEAHARWRA